MDSVSDVMGCNLEFLERVAGRQVMLTGTAEFTTHRKVTVPPDCTLALPGVTVTVGGFLILSGTGVHFPPGCCGSP